MHIVPEELAFEFAGVTWRLGRETRIMGILNVTPDSFSDGGDYTDVGQAVERGVSMAADGAAILDIGGESTHPGAAPVTVGEEIARTVPVIRELIGRTKVPISIDTRKAAVAAAALDAGAVIVNDVSGLQHDPDMINVLRDSRAGCIAMHMRGTPQTMQQFTVYEDMIADIAGFFRSLLARVEAVGISRGRIMLDPGIGFSKTAEQNLDLIANLGALRTLGRPLLAGPSRKSFIGKLLKIDEPKRRLWGTAGAVAACVLCGADVVRVHDVSEMVQVVNVANAIRTAGGRRTAGV